MSLKETERLHEKAGALAHLNAELNALYLEQDDIYSAYAAHFGLSDTAFWILYAVCVSDTVETQNSLAALFHMPPQSINSAVAALVGRGILCLRQRAGARSGKALCLTAAGEDFCSRVIFPFFEIEEQAIGALGALAERYVESARRVIAAMRDGVAAAIGNEKDTNEAEQISKEEP